MTDHGVVSTDWYGPMIGSDGPFMRRVRFHQAWYRVHRMGIREFGRLAGSDRPCGSVLPERAAAQGVNFMSPRALQCYSERRKMGWGVDPVRCTKYLTSSQALTINMLADVVDEPESCAAVFNALLGRSDLVWLDDWHLEFGRPSYLGDKTMLDGKLVFKTNSGRRSVVAIETKLADRFSTRTTAAMYGASYRSLGVRHGTWKCIEKALGSSETRQLTRCHALAHAVQADIDPSADEPPTLVALVHPSDGAAHRHASSYLETLAAPWSFRCVTWSTFLGVAAALGAMDEALSCRLGERYVDLWQSNESWLEQYARPKASETIEESN